MKIKIFKINRIFASIIIVSLIITTSFTNVNSSSLSSIINEKNSKKMDKIISTYGDDTYYFKQESIIKENTVTKLIKVINFIKLIFKDSREIVSLCNHTNVFLQILPDSICRIIYWFIFSPIVQILSNIWNYHPDYVIQYYAFLLLELVNEAYYTICDWSPTPIFNSKSVYGIATLSELIRSSTISPCPCMQR